MSHYFLCSQNKDSINHRFFQIIMIDDFVAADFFPKTPSPKPARIPPQTPPAGGKSVEAGRIQNPRQIVSPCRVLFSSFNHLDFARNSFELCPTNTAKNLKMTNETVKIKIKDENNDSEARTDSDEMNWRIEEPNFTPKTTQWFWALGILAFALIVFSILMKNYLLTIILALAAFIIYNSKNKKLEHINFRLDNDGLYIEDKFYPYDSFESFWIFPARGGSPKGGEAQIDEERELALRYNRHLVPLLIVPFYNNDEPEIRRILSEYLPESEEQESLIDLLKKRFF